MAPGQLPLPMSSVPPANTYLAPTMSPGIPLGNEMIQSLPSLGPHCGVSWVSRQAADNWPSVTLTRGEASRPPGGSRPLGSQLWLDHWPLPTFTWCHSGV